MTELKLAPSITERIKGYFAQQQEIERRISEDLALVAAETAE